MKPLTIPIKTFRHVSGIGTTKTYQLINRGVLRTIKIGRRTLITMESVEALLGSPEKGAE